MSNNSRYKYLAKNTLLLTISNFGSKILVFLLIPLYTRILTTSEYGIYDLIVTSVSLCIPIFTFNIQEAIIRFCLDKNKNPKTVLKTGLIINITSIIPIIIIIFFFRLFNFFDFINNYYLFFILMYIFESFYYLFVKYSRGIEKVKNSAIAGVINTVSILAFNILFLCKYKLGLYGYFLATLLSYIISTLYLVISLFKEINITVKSSQKERKEMIKYSSPLVFDTISWWIINASDRYVITFLLGNASNGIYSIAYKIPSLLNVFQSIFNQAWTISAVKEHDNNSSDFYSNVYEFYSYSMILMCSVLIGFDKVIAKGLFAKEFYSAWKYAPFLMISVVLGAMAGLLGGIFNANKDSKSLSQTTIVGSLTNIVLNIILVKKIGIIGAAISTLISYFFVWFIRTIKLQKKNHICLNIRKELINYAILIIQSVIILTIDRIIICYLLEATLISLIIIINFKTFNKIFNKLKVTLGR